MANFCSNCGAEIPVGEGFCPKCGSMASVGIGSTAPQMMNVQSNIGSAVSNGEKKESVVGIVAGVFGIVGIAMSIFLIGGIFGIVGIILGIIGLSKRQQYKTGMAVTGIATGGVAVLIVLFMLIGALAYSGGVNDGFDSGWDSGYDSGYEVPWYEKW